MAFLCWDTSKGRIVRELNRSVLIVGSDAIADIQLRHTSVSKRHALVQVDGTDVKITDLGSEGGTKINGAGLVPDVPSTLEPGDFVNIGGLVLTFHTTPPPVRSVPAPAAAAPRVPARQATPPPPAVASKPFPWMWVAVGLGFVAVGCIGALIAILVMRDDPQPVSQSVQAAQARQPDSVEAQPEPEPQVQPKPPEKKQPREGLPPRTYASLAVCPDLLELKDDTFAVVSVIDWTDREVKALGSDGELYVVPAAQVVKVSDRADVARRAQARRSRLATEDVDGRLSLAQWCAARHVRELARELAQAVLKDRPGDMTAQAILTRAIRK